MKTKLFLGFICMILIVISCKKEQKTQPEIVFKDSFGNVISDDTIKVVINSNHELIIETKYDLSKPEYLQQINEDNIIDITDSDKINLISHGWDGKLELNFENVRLTTIFSDTTFINGDEIHIIARINTLDGMISKSKIYKLN